MLNFVDPGVWVWQVQNCDYNRLKAFADTGFKWVAIQVHEGTNPVRTGDYSDLIRSARSLGLDVAGFGWLVDDPVAEAELADRMLHSWGLDGYIANGEKPLEYSQDKGPCPDCFNYSAAWCKRWKELRDLSTPLAFSSYAHFGQHDIHYRPWIEASAVAMPQAYWNEFDWARPAVSVHGALDVRQPWNGPPMGWPIDRIHVTFGNYQSGERPIPSPQAYAENLLQTSARGFNVYLGELMTEADFAAWKKLIPSLVIAASKPPLDERVFPYSGPHYGPSDTRGPDKCLTAKALKRALHRLGIEVFNKPDEHYNTKLETAMGGWQAPLGIPATGQYGKQSYEAMRSALAPDGTYAMDAMCLTLVRKEMNAVQE